MNIKINKSWSLFLDRDGVINKKLDNDYVKNWQEFKFLPYVKSSLAQLSQFFKYIIVFSNQQGIGKNLMTSKDLANIHKQMTAAICKAGGRIDKIYFCPHEASRNCLCRKPALGMALQAKEDFPDIDFRKSIMVGDSEIDMKFGKGLGSRTVFINKKQVASSADHVVKNLREFASLIIPKNSL
ncbi:MAG: HAD-IIIA family hydrolase [Candidatus Margulisbacteria bacterium]|nr:HAD-IIIA family hydrolase [Candidatus Margulisiibacteriota bacterium]